MKRAEVHDLLQIDHASLNSECAAEPSWVRQTMLNCPWVVVRRSQAASDFIAIGVRGENRSERWAASCEKTMVREILRPEDLLLRDRNSNDVRRTPARRALQAMS